MKYLLITLLLVGCASKPISHNESDFYIGCIGGALGRHNLTNPELHQNEFEAFVIICRSYEQQYNVFMRKQKVKIERPRPQTIRRYKTI